MKLAKIFIIFLLLLTLISVVHARRKAFRSGGGRNQGVAKVGRALGDAVVSIINDIRGISQPVPKGYKRQIDRPVIQQYTLYGKIKNGLKNFIFLGIALLAAIILAIIYKIYMFIKQQLYRHRLSRLSPEAQRSLAHNALQFSFNPNSSSQKKVACVGIDASQQRRKKAEQSRRLFK